MRCFCIAAIAVAALEFLRADRTEQRPSTPSTPSTSTTRSGPPTTTVATDTTVVTSTDVVTPTAPAAPSTVVIGANCTPVGSTGTTADGSTAYCSTLQGTGTTIWSLTQGDVPSPTVTVTTAPTEAPLAPEEESPVRVCMEQTGQTRRECRDDIRQSNGLPPLP